MIENRRARNLGEMNYFTTSTYSLPSSVYIVIAKRRIGHTSQKVLEFIINTDLDGLLSEHCELLLKFIPTEDEVIIIMSLCVLRVCVCCVCV